MSISKPLGLPLFISISMTLTSSVPALANCSDNVSYWETANGECVDLTHLTGVVTDPTISQPAATQTPPQPPFGEASPGRLVAQLPIIDRQGGTPVVVVTLTGNQGTQQFPILFDTGATGTLITPGMAQAVGVPVVGEETSIVADGRQVQFPVGSVSSLEVGGLVIQNIAVGIGGDVGLLGQDVYGQYNIVIGDTSIDLYE